MSPGLLLHASELGFTHPMSGLSLQFSIEHLKYPGEPYTKR
jgi:23S rRNA-/tRNA-specific pseudouridylate synthase